MNFFKAATILFRIYLHSKDIDLDFPSVRVTNGLDEIAVTGHEVSLDQDFYIVHMAEHMEEGDSYVLYVEFVSPLAKDKLVGFYRTKYKDPETGEEKVFKEFRNN